MSSRIRVRPATPAHLGALVALETSSFRGPYAAHRWDEREFAKKLADPQAMLWVAEVEGAVVGYLAGWRRSGRLAHVSRLLSIAVDARFRRAGIGRALLRRFLRTTTCRLMTLEVAVGNTAARRLFEQHGFRAAHTLSDYYGEGHDALRMHRV